MLELPWPPQKLNPNNLYKNEAAHNRVFQKYKFDCKVLAMGKPPLTQFRVEFHPPINRPLRNVDNAIASVKAMCDGLADAWKMDDSDFIIHWPATFSDPVKGGAVRIYRGEE